MSLLYSCTKEKTYNEPVIEIYSPNLEQEYLLPNSININCNIEHNKPIEYVRLSVDNKNMISISQQLFLSPSSNYLTIDTNLTIKILSNEAMQPPYFVHIVVGDLIEDNHYYREIVLHNGQKSLKGYFLITNQGVNVLNIRYYNSLFQTEYNFEAVGNYNASGISTNSSSLFVSSSTPDRTIAYNSVDGNISWTKNPQLPYPRFNNIAVDNNRVYISTEIGRIIGLDNRDGTQVFSTPVLPDSVPNNICLTKDYLVSDFTVRNSNSKFWTVFYKQTGYKYRVVDTNFETVDLYANINENRVIAFCNTNSNGRIITYDITNNNIEETIIIDNISIDNSCKIDNNNYLFSSNNFLFHADIYNKTSIKIASADDNIIDLKFNYINNQIILVYSSKVEILSYPQLTIVKTINSNYLMEEIELLYGYNK